MKRTAIILLFSVFSFGTLAFGQNTQRTAIEAQMHEKYEKTEVMVPMRDGVKLYTAIYTPKDNSEKHPILMHRSPYSCSPYGERFSFQLYSKQNFYNNNYIFVFQDVRGRYHSEGEFVQVRPLNKKKKGIDEATDTYDTIEWLIKNVKNNNGKVGTWGISYDGFYATMTASSNHPALKAVSPQAPVTDWFRGDDRHHNGAFTFLQTTNFLPALEGERQGRGVTPDIVKHDVYTDYLRLGTFANADSLVGNTVKMWNDIRNHPNFDSFWQERDARQSCYNLKPAMLVVGGTFDSEDCYGAWGTYEAIKKQSPNTELYLAFGPWYHGGWTDRNYQNLGNIYFGNNLNKYYQDEVEYAFFRYYLEGKGEKPKPVSIFYSGSNKWETMQEWPVSNIDYTPYYLHKDGTVDTSAPKEQSSATSYYSDLSKPVPFYGEPIRSRIIEYMTGDQRFATSRPDVISFYSDVLTEPVKLGGPIDVELFTSMTGTDADFIVKVIDVYPENYKYTRDITNITGNYTMSGYELMVRGEVFRGRYRNSFENPEAFVPNQITPVNFRLYDVAHTFMPGHRIMVQIHSTWFPLIDRNPQQFIDTYHCKVSDLKNETISIYHQADAASRVILPIVK